MSRPPEDPLVRDCRREAWTVALVATAAMATRSGTAPLRLRPRGRADPVRAGFPVVGLLGHRRARGASAS